MTGVGHLLPELHVVPPRGWLNDANGLTYTDGRFHVFYQSDPERFWFGRMQWGHASSTDLLHWETHPPALSPSGPGPDVDGCWSGCIVPTERGHTAVYTGVTALGGDRWVQKLCLAYSDDPGLVTWQKDGSNPQEIEAPAGLSLTGFRDPSVWREDGAWRMVIGTGFSDGRGAVLSYRSDDLRKWAFEGVLYDRPASDREPLWTGRIWECPSLSSVDGQHLLVFSVWDDTVAPTLHYAAAAAGRVEDGRLVPRHLQRFDWGPHCYAPAVMRHPDGRLLAWGWCWEALTEQGRQQQGWAGCLTLPRELSLDADGRLLSAPLRELGALRSRPVVVSAAQVQPGQPLALPASPPGPWELELALAPAGAEGAELVILASPDDEERTVITFDFTAKWATVDTTSSSGWPEATGSTCGGPLDLVDGRLELRVVHDGSILEIFVGRYLSLTVRAYPLRSDSTCSRLAVPAGAAGSVEARLWELMS